MTQPNVKTTKVVLLPSATISLMADSFTDTKETVLKELLQNARRAGATSIDLCINLDTKRLTITDNGQGIMQVEDILVKGASSWDQETKDAENPFGMGFLSAVFAAESVNIHSSFGYCTLTKESVMANADIQFFTQQTSASYGYTTRIELLGFHLATKYDAVMDMMAYLTQGFPIPVNLYVFNGRPLPFSKIYEGQESLSSLHKGVNAGARPRSVIKETEFGTIFLDDILDYSFSSFESLRNWRLHVYLQGLPISLNNAPWRSSREPRCIVHLADNVKARRPDRAIVHNAEDIATALDKEVRTMRLEGLTAAKAELSPEEFIRYVDLARKLRAVNVYDDVPMLSGQWISSVTGDPLGNDSNCSLTGEDITQEEALSGEVQLYSMHGLYGDDVYQRGSEKYCFFRAVDARILDMDEVSENHWVRKPGLVKDVEGVEITGVIQETHRITFCTTEGDTISVVVCTGVELTAIFTDEDLEAETVRVEEIVWEYGSDTLYVPMNKVRQKDLCYYCCNSGDSEVTDRDSDSLHEILMALTANTPAEGVQRLLPEFPRDIVAGKTFSITFDARGKLESVVEQVPN